MPLTPPATVHGLRPSRADAARIIPPTIARSHERANIGSTAEPRGIQLKKCAACLCAEKRLFQHLPKD
jgi:hypothetical protein